MKHSELITWASGLTIDNKPMPPSLIRDLAVKTRFGVDAEGGDARLNQASDSSQSTQGQAAIAGPKYALGNASKKELVGVYPKLIMIVENAIGISTQDFTVFDGIRTLKEQAQYVKSGTSKTMQSLHLPQSDGFGHAVDLVPWINGHAVWDWDGCYRIALAVDEAATRLGFAHNIRWGGAWDRRLSDFGGSVDSYKKAVSEYQARHPGPDFLDGPHYEWVMGS